MNVLRVLHGRHCFHTAWGSLQHNSFCVWYYVRLYLLSSYETTSQESLVLVFLFLYWLLLLCLLDSEHWSFYHNTWLKNVKEFELRTQSVPDICSCAAQTSENNYFSGAGVDLWNPNYVAAPGTCVFVCVPVCHVVWVSSASVRVRSGFVTFTAAVCGDKANQSVEWRSSVILGIRTCRLRWRFLRFILPVDKLHTTPTCGNVSLLVWKLNCCAGKFTFISMCRHLRWEDFLYKQSLIKMGLNPAWTTERCKWVIMSIT